MREEPLLLDRKLVCGPAYNAFTDSRQPVLQHGPYPGSNPGRKLAAREGYAYQKRLMAQPVVGA